MVWLSDSNANRLKNSYFNDRNDTGVTVDVSGNVLVQHGKIEYGIGISPIGGIMMWNGTFNSDGTVPGYEEWEICDGTNGKPDLRGRFIISSTYGTSNVGDLGTITYELEGIGGLQSVSLTESEIPAHTHTTSTQGSHNHYFSIYSGNDFYFEYQGRTYTLAADDIGFQSATNYTNSSGAHSHVFSSIGSGISHENRPPYYVLAFIIRVT
jgi:microcystin-dependent protein